MIVIDTATDKMRVGTQWFKNGDHPHDFDHDIEGLKDGVMTTFTGEYRREHDWEGSVVRRFRNPYVDDNLNCPVCDKRMQDHGWIDEGEHGTTVCPGDFVMADKNGRHYTLSAHAFHDLPSVCLESKEYLHHG